MYVMAMPSMLSTNVNVTDKVCIASKGWCESKKPYDGQCSLILSTKGTYYVIAKV